MNTKVEEVYPSGDLRNLFGALAAFDTERQRARRVAELNEKIRKVGTRCGDCDKWMKSRICPKEHNVNGYTRGPSCDGFICTQFVESASATNHRATLIAALNQEQGK